jgi:hypothetical protein
MKADARLRAIERRAVAVPESPAIEHGLPDLERMFVHMHLGRPPARVLFLGSTVSLSTEITAFGFDVASASDEGGFVDIVIALPDEEGRQGNLDDIACQAARVLRPGGKLLGAWRNEPLSLLTPSWQSLFEPRIVMTGERAGGGWEVRGQSSADATAATSGSRRENVMIEALRLDAPDR